MKKLLALCFLTYCFQLKAQDSLNSTAQLTFIYPLGTHGVQSYKYKNKFSLNILAGINRGFNGLEIGSLLNINKGNCRGIQIAGLLNVNTKSFKGAQFGFINSNKTVSGFQWGFINISDTSKNCVSFGMFNYIKHGFRELKIVSNETVFGSLQFDMGTDKIYTSYILGYTQGKNQNLVCYGLGFGTQHHLKRMNFLNIEANLCTITDQTFSNNAFNGNIKLTAYFKHYINKVCLFVGPVFNYYINNSTDQSLNTPYNLIASAENNFWVGLQAGLGFNFKMQQTLL